MYEKEKKNMYNLMETYIFTNANPHGKSLSSRRVPYLIRTQSITLYSKTFQMLNLTNLYLQHSRIPYIDGSIVQ